MSIPVTAYVTRELLALSPLEVNDHITYALTATIMGGQTAWERNEASSPWVDGEFTVSRKKRNVTEQIVIDVYGADQVELQDNIKTLIEAFTQDNYGLLINVTGAQKAYKCFAADYQVSWTHTRVHALNVPVTFNVPRMPNPLLGV